MLETRPLIGRFWTSSDQIKWVQRINLQSRLSQTKITKSFLHSVFQVLKLPSSTIWSTSKQHLILICHFKKNVIFDPHKSGSEWMHILKLGICEIYSRRKTDFKGSFRVKNLKNSLTSDYQFDPYVPRLTWFIYGRKYSLPPISIAFRPKMFLKNSSHKKFLNWSLWFQI